MVQVSVRVAVPSRSVAELALTGSYVPKASEVALTVQLFETVALTEMEVVVVPARAVLGINPSTPNDARLPYAMYFGSVRGKSKAMILQKPGQSKERNARSRA